MDKNRIFEKKKKLGSVCSCFAMPIFKLNKNNFIVFCKNKSIQHDIFFKNVFKDKKTKNLFVKNEICFIITIN